RTQVTPAVAGSSVRREVAKRGAMIAGSVINMCERTDNPSVFACSRSMRFWGAAWVLAADAGAVRARTTYVDVAAPPLHGARD
ncbi:MAG: hypothetical protein KC486_34375, partial [Myxococcales bacterium]|nr:hypothetical protein [Myxococcales bacterium]